MLLESLGPVVDLQSSETVSQFGAEPEPKNMQVTGDENVVQH